MQLVRRIALAVRLGLCGRCWPAFWVVAIGFGRYVVYVGIGLERFGRFWTLLDAIWVVTISFGCYVLGLAVSLHQNFRKSIENASNLGRGGQFWLLRTQASGRSGPEFHKKYRKCIKFFAKS